MNHPGETVCVLLIEDSPFDSFLFRTLLSKLSDAQFKLLHAEHLKSSLVLLRDNAVDIIFTDLNLPDSSGLDAVHTLISSASGVPVVVLSGRDDLDLESRLLSQGASGLLPKEGLTAAALSRAIHQAIQRNAANPT
jgi:DNA-binding NarL/FixJ family response regulator